jgi:hypothetical protein
MNNRLPRMQTVRWAAPLIALFAAITAGTLFGVQLVVLTFAAFALLLVIWLLWSSVQALAGESPLTFEEAFSLGARSAEEEQKRAVLRALKDLEYERTVGKIEEQDFLELSEKYRAEARGLLQLVDENLGSTRREVLAVVQRRVDSELGVAPASTAAESTDRDDGSGGAPAADKTKVETVVDAAQQERADG